MYWYVWSDCSANKLNPVLSPLFYACEKWGDCRTPGRGLQNPASPDLHTARSIPRTPLAVTMAKLQQAEADHLKDRVQMRRELDQQRRRASGLEHRYSQLQVALTANDSLSPHSALSHQPLMLRSACSTRQNGLPLLLKGHVKTDLE